MSICESCRERKAVDTCPVCGTQVCRDCMRNYGCKLCGGETKMD